MAEELASGWEETSEYHNYSVPFCFPSFCRQKSDKMINFLKKKKKTNLYLSPKTSNEYKMNSKWCKKALHQCFVFLSFSVAYKIMENFKSIVTTIMKWITAF